MNRDTLILIHKLLVILRSDIHGLDNKFIISVLRNILKKRFVDEEILKQLNKIETLKKLNITLSNGFYSNNDISRIAYDEEKIIRFLFYALNEIESAINNNMYAMAYDIVDSIHIFPELFINRYPGDHKRYWTIYIKPIQKKWNKKLFMEVKDIFS